MGTVKPKRIGTYRCQDCGLVVNVTNVNNKTQHGELLCCNEPMKAD